MNEREREREREYILEPSLSISRTMWVIPALYPMKAVKWGFKLFLSGGNAFTINNHISVFHSLHTASNQSKYLVLCGDQSSSLGEIPNFRALELKKR